MLEGACNEGFITPAFSKLLAEWHPECFGEEFKLKPQFPPYKCESCKKKIIAGKVTFVVMGSETSETYTVAEGRGYQIYLVKHASGCPK
jgi:hypothetical protein